MSNNYNYSASLVCKQNLESHNIDTSNYNEDDNFFLAQFMSIDDVPVIIPLLRKHNLRAYNFSFE